jgi:mannonate dehydratase
MDRRKMLQMAGSAVAGAVGVLGQKNEALAQTYSKATRGLPPLKITSVKAIKTCPNRSNFVVVKVQTSEPGLYGVGCATLSTRGAAVVTAIEDFLAPFLVGRDPAEIEDIWQTSYYSSYWRNGQVLNPALSGVDMALWDIKGKRANMPIYGLLGGKSRFAVATYCHADGKTLEELSDNVQKFVEAGWNHVRIQQGGYGSAAIAGSPGQGNSDFMAAGFGGPYGDYGRSSGAGFQDNTAYMLGTIKMFEYIRNKFGDSLELIHDMHERLDPIEAVRLVKQLEQFRPFYAEDPLAPEQIAYFKMMREQCTTQIAMGELFDHPLEWVGLISDRQIDFIRVGFQHIGGITPGLKVARLAEAFGVRTAWHGPGDFDPIGHAAQGHVDLTVHNFGIQEEVDLGWPEITQEVFPGCPTMKKGYMYINEAPGIGVDINEELAAKYPWPAWPAGTGFRFPIRNADGTQITP